MYSLICRIMIVVFLVNCLIPAQGWGQTSRRSANKSLNKQLEEKVTRAQQEKGPAAQFAQADRQIRQAHNKRFAQADQQLQEQTPEPEPKKDFAQMRQAIASLPFDEQLKGAASVPQDNTYLPARVPVKKMERYNDNQQIFLKKVANNELQFKDLIEYVDPMDPDINANNPLLIAYAAEVLGNSVEETVSLDESLYDFDEFYSLLPQVQARLLYRLALLGHVSPSYSLNKMISPVSLSRAQLQSSYKASIAKTEAVGSLRMALLKIHRIYQRKGMPDPVDEYQKQMLAKQMQNTLPAPTRQSWVERPSTLVVDRTNTMQAHQIMQDVDRATTQYGNLASFQREFLTELKKLKEQEPEEDSAEFEHLQILADYATAYTVEYNPAGLKDIVALFDEGAGKNEFNQKYSPILNAIFVSIFENTRYSSMGEAKTKHVLSLLEQFSDPQKYSLPTRVFALEAAGLLYRPFNEDTIKNAVKPSFAFFAPFNLNKPDEKLRYTFALRTSELYCPLVTTSSSAMNTYGLDSQQMQKLADKLAYIYDGFYDIHTSFLEDPAHPSRIREGFPAKCSIVMHNEPNRLKAQQETTGAVLTFTAEALFWIYGGEVFSLLGTAFRLTRGAVVALPKARKAFSLAARGEKIAAFNAEVRNGAKFANWVYKNKKQQGNIVEVAVKEKSTALVPKSQRGAQAAIEPKYVRVDHTYQLENKNSHWNWRRWVGLNPEQEIVGLRVTRLQPNFNVTVAQANFANGEFANGLHSMQDIEKAWSQLRLVTDKTQPMLYETKPYFSAMLDFRQAQMEQSLLQGLENSFKNSMDVLVPVSDLPPTKKFKFGIDVLFEGERAWTAEEIAAHTKWWDMTRWGNLYQSARTDMKVFVAARSNAIPNTPVPGGIDLPANLPGFTTTLERMATGQWRQDAFKAFFKPMNWADTPTNSQLLTSYGKWGRRLRQAGRTLGRVFLPDYLPTPLFWQTAKASPMFAVKMVPQLIWRQRFVGSSIGLGIWEGSDHLIYPPYLQWLKTETVQDTQEETRKYGETFSKQRTKMTEWMMKELKIYNSNSPSMSTYEDIMQSEKDQPEGTLLSAPIIFARRLTNDIPLLGEVTGIEFISDDSKAAYEHRAHESDLNHARLQQMYTTWQQNQTNSPKRQELEAQFKAQLDAAYDKILAKYPLGFAKLPQAKKQLRDLFDKYIADSFASGSREKQKQIDKNFLQQKNQLVLKVDLWNQTLSDYETTMQTLHSTYAQDAQFITPAVKQQIRDIYETFAQQYIRSVLPHIDSVPEQMLGNRLTNQLQNALRAIRTDLADRWKVKYPLWAYEQELKSYEQGFTALPQYKEPLKQLISRFSADMHAAQTDEQQASVREEFHKQYGELMTPITIWEKSIQDGEKVIDNLKMYHKADLITPAIEQKIRTAYVNYAKAYVESVLPLPKKERAQAASKLSKKRQEQTFAVWNIVQKREIANNPDESYEGQLKQYSQGFAALPQYKESLKRLYTRFAANMKAVKTEQAEAALIEDFSRKSEQLLEPVLVWEKSLSDIDQTVEDIKYQYDDLVTPAIEEQIRTAYVNYAKAYVESVLPLPKQERAQAASELSNKLAEQTFVVWNIVQKRWIANNPDEAYEGQLEQHPQGFAALPQYKESLQQLYTRFAADMKAVKTEQAETALMNDFEQKFEALLEPVNVWEESISMSYRFINSAKYQYGDLVTPAIEEQVHQIYQEYAKAYVESVLPLPQEQREDKQKVLDDQREQLVEAIIDALEQQLEAEYPQDEQQEEISGGIVPEDEPEYGTQWNATIGQE